MHNDSHRCDYKHILSLCLYYVGIGILKKQPAGKAGCLECQRTPKSSKSSHHTLAPAFKRVSEERSRGSE